MESIEKDYKFNISILFNSTYFRKLETKLVEFLNSLTDVAGLIIQLRTYTSHIEKKSKSNKLESNKNLQSFNVYHFLYSYIVFLKSQNKIFR